MDVHNIVVVYIDFIQKDIEYYWSVIFKKNYKNTTFFESFGWILLNSKLIGVIGIVSTYLTIWEKRVNCGNTIAEIQQKLKRER